MALHLTEVSERALLDRLEYVERLSELFAQYLLMEYRELPQSMSRALRSARSSGELPPEPVDKRRRAVELGLHVISGDEKAEGALRDRLARDPGARIAAAPKA